MYRFFQRGAANSLMAMARCMYMIGCRGTECRQDKDKATQEACDWQDAQNKGGQPTSQASQHNIISLKASLEVCLLGCAQPEKTLPNAWNKRRTPTHIGPEHPDCPGVHVLCRAGGSRFCWMLIVVCCTLGRHSLQHNVALQACRPSSQKRRCPRTVSGSN